MTPSTPGNWGFSYLGAATAGFEAGPGTPPLGSGSAYFDLPTAADFTALRTTDYDNVKLSDLTTLTYWTNVSQNQNCQAPYISLNICQSGAPNTFDDRLNFEPCYQTGGYSMLPDGGASVPDQCPDPSDALCFPLNTWVEWNAMVGGWWANSDNTGGPPLRTIQSYISEHPTPSSRDSPRRRTGRRYQYVLSIPSLPSTNLNPRTGTYRVEILINNVSVPTPLSPGGEVRFDIK